MAVASGLTRFGHRTVLVVAHRIETIARAEHILFVENGRIAEAGDREALIAAGGRFAADRNSRRSAKDWTLAG